MKPSKARRLLPRLWYYFRLGYSTYIIFAIGFFGSTSAIYYLAIQSIPALESVFSSYGIFLAAIACAFIPSSMFAGWVHMKRSTMYKSEQDIAAEANPYNFKGIPGKDIEVALPSWTLTLLVWKRFAEKYGLIKDPEELLVFDEMARQFKWLSDGHDIRTYVPKVNIKPALDRMLKELEELEQTRSTTVK